MIAAAVALPVWLGQYTPAEAATAAVIVLDLDDDIAHTVWPGEPEMGELELSHELALELKNRLEIECRSQVVLTRGDSPGVVSRAERKAVAVEAGADLMVTLAFNAFTGYPWGVQTDGGPEAYARPQDVGFGQALLDQIAAYTGRSANGPVQTAANSPWYPDYGDLAFPWVHLETLFLDHNYDHPIITTAFDLVVDGVYAGIRDQMETMGLTCGSPYPARPSADELERLRNLGYQNYLRYGADPVSMSTGDFVTSEALLSLTGVGDQAMDFELTYNAQSGLDSPVGQGWTYSYGAYTQLFDDDSAGIVLPDGRGFVFDADGAGGFVSPDDAFATLTWGGDGSTLTWESSVGEIRTFAVDDQTGRGRLTSVSDRSGKTLTLFYDGAGALFWKLARVTDTAGQTVAVETDDDGRVTALTRPDGAIWRLGYSPDGDLVALTKPGGGTLRYDYDAEHRMIAQTGADDVTWLRNQYDDQSRVVRQTTSMGYTRTLVFNDRAQTTTYTDATGAVTVYHWNSEHQVVKVVDALGGETVSDYLGNSLTSSQRSADGAVTTYEYNAAGQPTAVSDPTGATTRSLYNAAGDLIEATDELGQTTSYQVDARGLPVVTTYPDGSTTRQEYDANGDLVQVTDQLGAVTKMGYDARGNLTSVIDPLGNTTAFDYDLANRVVLMTDPLGAVTAYEYDLDDHLTAVRLADGSSETGLYDVNGKLVSLTGRRGETWTFAYDSELYLIAETAPDGGVTRYQYDVEQRLTQLVQADGSTIVYSLDALGREVARTDARGEVFQTAYDAAGRVASETDEAGYITSYAYDARGLLSAVTYPDGGIATTAYDQAGRVVAQTDQLGAVTTYAHDWRGQVVESVDPLGRATVYQYDAAGRLVRQTDPAGAATAYDYDAAGRLAAVTNPLGLTTRASRDAAGRVVEVTDPVGWREAAYVYDAVGDVVSSYQVGAGTTDFELDAGGLVAKATDALGRVTAWSYDSMGRVVEQTDPTGAVTRQSWDQLGNLTTVTDATGRLTSFEHDSAGNLVAVVENATGGPQTATTDVKTAYSYEPRGLLSAVTNPLGGVTSYQYGSDGQLWRETDPVGNTTEYSYDLAGNLVSRERGGVTTSYSHDAAGQLVGRAYSNDSAPETFAYDLAGRQTAATNHSGTVVTSYDLAGQVTSVTDANGRTTAYSYDARGLRVSMTLPDGALTTYTWDAERRNTAMGTSLGRVTFAYDAVGREVSQTRPNGNTVRTAWTADDQIDRLTTTRVVCKKEKVLSDFDYSYDILGNVVALSRTVGTDKTILAYSYDELGRLTASTNSDKQEEDNLYVYDAAGDRVGWTHGTDLSKPTKYVTQTNTYDLAGELVESLDESMPSSTSRQTRLTVNTWQSGDLVRSQTTAERSTLSKGAVKSTRSQWSEDRRFTYDAESRLTSATQWGLKTKKGLTQEIQCGQDTSGDYGCPVGVDRSADPPDHGASQAPARNSLTRQYDALGRAVAQTNGGLETVRWTYDGLDPIYAETTVKKKTTATELIRDAAGRLLGQNTLALKLDGDWFLTDALGSVHAAVSRSGSCLSDKTWYSDWGVQQKENDLLVGYSGELRDPTQNGLVNFYARSYQPEYALWHQPDPFRGLLEIPGSTRAYTYVLLNPITMDELYGYWGFPSIVGAITLAVIGAVAVAAICVGTAGLGCVAAVAAGAFVGGAVGGYIGARVEGASNSSAILFGVKAGTIAAGAVLTGGAAGVGAAGAGGAGLVVAGGGVVGTGASVSASGAMVVVGGGMIAAGGRAEVAYAYGDPGDYGDGTDRQKNGTPKSPKAQNKQAREAIQAAERILKRTLTKSEKQRVHWALKHQNMSFDEIVNVVLQMFS